jgi:hypothetical protein
MMSDTQPDGLASLTDQRKRARRSMPAPRHPVTVEVHAPGSDVIADPATPAGLPAPVEPVVPRSAPKAKQRPPAPDELGAPFKVTLYVDRDTDEFMETVRVEGLTSRPKVDVSRSAVVRLALRRLMDEMSPVEVKALLADQAVRSTGPGRKRR